MKDDVISRQAAIDVLSLGKEILSRVLDDIDVVGTDREKYSWGLGLIESNIEDIKELPSARPERLTDDDFETIRIHLNAYKEKLCNLQRWEEAEEYQRIIDRFMAFASAQPDHSGDVNGKVETDKRAVESVQNVPNDDLIFRKAATDAVSRGCQEFRGIFARCEKNLNELPSAHPERKTGKWIEEPNCYYRCSECGEHYPSILGYMNYNFCPHCGADMRGWKGERNEN